MSLRDANKALAQAETDKAIAKAMARLQGKALKSQVLTALKRRQPGTKLARLGLQQLEEEQSPNTLIGRRGE